MERSIFQFILAYSKREQIILMLITLMSFPFLYFSLDLPKIIINEAIIGGEQVRDLFGYSLDQLPYLFVLCGIFLLLVLCNGGFKYFINVYRGQMAEQMLRRIRYTLFSRVLRFPLPHFSKLSQGEIVSIITAEAEPLGGFFGEAFSLPLYQGGILITILGFIALQDPYMGIAAIVLYPLQMWMIPKLQKHVNQLAKQRIMNVRKISEHISETVDGIHEVHANDTSQYELSGISNLLGLNFNIRLQIYRRKFFIKFLNNFIAQITPFFFYSIGGYLVIKGDLSFGALVATLAAYKDLAAPWKELLGWYQRKEDTRIKYDQLVERFHPEGMIDETLQTSDPDGFPDIAEKPISIANLGWQDEGGIKAIDGVSLHISPGEKILIIAGGGSGKEHFARMLARILSPTTGNIQLDGDNIARFPESVTGRQIAYANSEAFMFNGTIAQNLLYGLNHRPSKSSDAQSDETKAIEIDIKTALQAGNSGYYRHADWTNYSTAQLTGPDQLSERIIHILHTVGLDGDVYAMGLQSRIDPAINGELSTAILKVRAQLGETLKQPGISQLIEPFDETSYNENSTVAENLLFGTPVGEQLATANLAENTYVLDVLRQHDLLTKFAEMGVLAAKAMDDLFSDLPPGHEFFERYGFINSDDLPEYSAILMRVERSGLSEISETDYNKLVALPFNLAVARHRLGIITEDIQNKILQARKTFRNDLPDNLKDAIEFFNISRYNATATIQDNILFGHLSYNQKEAKERIGVLIREAVDELGLYEDLMIAGLELSVGIGGRRLALAQRQKVSLARCLLKRPDLLIMDEIFSALEADEKKRIISRVLAEITGTTVVYIDSDDSLTSLFTRKLFIKQGRLTEADVDPDKLAPMDKPAEVVENLAEEVLLLRKIPMLSSFDTSTLKLLAFTSKRLSFEVGEDVFQQGEKGDTAYIVIDGQAEILVDTDDGPAYIRNVEANEIFGEIALLGDVPRTATVRVKKKMTTLELSKQQFFALMEQDTRVVIDLLKQSSARLEQTTALLAAQKNG